MTEVESEPVRVIHKDKNSQEWKFFRPDGSLLATFTTESEMAMALWGRLKREDEQARAMA